MLSVTKARKIKKVFSILLMALMVSSFTFAVAEATPAAPGASSMPWEAGLQLLVDSVSGPVAQAIALIAIVAAGAALIFGGDMTGFMRTAVYVVLVIGLILGAANLMKALGPTTSALLPFIK